MEMNESKILTRIAEKHLQMLTASSDVMFPASDRCVFERAPLSQVACQLRFPALLAIESSPPADFQERIRAVFPFLERNKPRAMSQFPAEIMQLLNAGTGQLGYSFLTEDRATTLNLAPDGILLSTSRYTRWESFWRMLQEPIRALVDIYRPSFFTRVGLRYTNVINRESLGLAEIPWSRLLRREILGELALPQFERALDRLANRSLRLKLPEDLGSVLLQHGLAIVAGAPPSQLSYLIDMDFSNEPRMELGNATPTLDRFHELAGNAFRWTITPELYNAMGPTDSVTGHPKRLRTDSF
jgi:uncharacterized protein (TIGR04255 family)